MPTVKTKEKENRYLEAVGRRKCAIARIRLFPGEKNKGEISVNEKELAVYFPTLELRETLKEPLKKTKTENDFFISAKVNGGGVRAQAEAVRLGISRALLKHNPDLRPVLKVEGFLTRDSRAKERRKFGLKKARKAPQWSKR